MEHRDLRNRDMS